MYNFVLNKMSRNSTIQIRKKLEINYKEWNGRCKPLDTPHNTSWFTRPVSPERLQQHKKEVERHVSKRSTKEN